MQSLSHLSLHTFFHSVNAGDAYAVRAAISRTLTDTADTSCTVPLWQTRSDEEQIRFLRSDQARPIREAISAREDRFSCELKPGLRRLLETSSASPVRELFRTLGATRDFRGYQGGMLRDLGNDILAHAAPWLGLGAPMQTGKSHLIPDIIRLFESLYGPDTEFIILSSARIITNQLLSDLLGKFNEWEIGRLDGRVKAPRRITVASFYTLHRDQYLEEFPLNRRRILILDQASFTKAPAVRKILVHFGAAERIVQDGKVRLKPRSGRVRLIGLSGTAVGLEGYHVSSSLDLPTAVERGWIRPLKGERVFPTVTTQHARNAQEKMIWWRPTERNARILVDLYHEKIHGQGLRKTLVYAPTIRHGELLRKEFARRYGEGFVHFVHSNQEPEIVDETIERWNTENGILISIKMLSQGFRGGGVDAVFHTYQSNSPELFAERTGRAWGVQDWRKFLPLYILEATWDRERFSNLARLLGLVDYPDAPLDIGKGFQRTYERMRRRADYEDEVVTAVRQGRVETYFKGIPVLEEWRRLIGRIASTEEALQNVSRTTGISIEALHGFALGSLPIRREDVDALRPYFRGDRALETWVRAWETVVSEAVEGTRAVLPNLEGKLLSWRDEAGSLEDRAQALDRLLSLAFPVKRRRRRQSDPNRVQEVISGELQRAETRGERVTPTELARRVHAVLIRGLSEDQWPSKDAIRGLVGKMLKDASIRRTLQGKGALESRRQARQDFQKIEDLFQDVFFQALIRGEKLSAAEAAARVHDLCRKSFPRNEVPALGTVLSYATGKTALPAVAKLLANHPSARPARVEFIPKRLMTSFRKAVREADRNKYVPGLKAIAVRARDFYIQGLPEREHPSPDAFKTKVSGPSADAEIVALIKGSRYYVPTRVAVDRPRMLKAFFHEIRRAARRGEVLGPTELAARSRQRYNRNLPENEHPSDTTFFSRVCGPNADSEIMAYWRSS